MREGQFFFLQKGMDFVQSHTPEEIAEIITHSAFYAGWSKAWAAFNMAKEVWTEE